MKTNAMQRPDFAAIANWVKPGARILDLGCGDGSLLRYLNEQRGGIGYGVEIDDEGILACARNGVNVIQGDLERGLSGFADGSFDYVILSQTLQAVRSSERIVREMLRVGRQGIVTFPNFGYWRNRLHVMLGNMPVSDNLPPLARHAKHSSHHYRLRGVLPRSRRTHHRAHRNARRRRGFVPAQYAGQPRGLPL